jgi:hypothetical protein
LFNFRETRQSLDPDQFHAAEVFHYQTYGNMTALSQQAHHHPSGLTTAMMNQA